MEPWTAQRQTGTEHQDKAVGPAGRRGLLRRRRSRGARGARAAATAEELQKRLPDSFAVVSGVRVWYRGRPLFLEHVVTGPTGIFLAATVEGNPRWREDLTRAAAFFTENLGPYSQRFTVLAITGEAMKTAPLPCIRPVESALAAAAVMVEEGTGDVLSPEALREIRERIEMWQVQGPKGPGAGQGFTWREWVSLGSVVVLTTVMVADAQHITVRDWLPILLVLALPLAAVLWLVNRIPSGRLRAVLSYTIMMLVVGVTLLLSLAAWLS
ncbi:MAG TPA: hypothetical protein VIL07_04390 [Symbiobacteriaceae bacterium]